MTCGNGTRPIGHWHLNENAGTTTVDASGNGAIGTLSGPPIWLTGRWGSGLSFIGGIGARVVTTDVAKETNFDFTIDDDFYMLFTYRPLASRTSKPILSKAATTSAQGWRVIQQTQGFLAFQVTTVNGVSECLNGFAGLGNIPAGLNDGKYHLVQAGWHNTGVCSTSARIFIDTFTADSDASVTFPIGITNDVSFDIGGDSGGGTGADIDEVIVCRGLLTDELQQSNLRAWHGLTNNFADEDQ